LESCLADTLAVAEKIAAPHFTIQLNKLMRGCLCVVATEKVFESFHPQGTLRHAPPRAGPDPVKDLRGVVSDALVPLLQLIHGSVEVGMFSAFAHGDKVPALEHCVTRFLHEAYLLHLEFIQGCSRVSITAAVSVPVQNTFRGVHQAFMELCDSSIWRAAITRTVTVAGTERCLDANWSKAVEMAKYFALLPTDHAGCTKETAPNVAFAAWSLVHYFFQQSSPSAPTAPPAPAADAFKRGAEQRAWDDYEQYFAQMNAGQQVGSITDIPLNFPLTPPRDATVAYRLSRLLSSHLRGLSEVMVYFRVLHVSCRRSNLLDQCAHYCAALVDLIERSSHNHGVAVPFLLAALHCHESTSNYASAVETAKRIRIVLWVLQDLPCSALLHQHGEELVQGYSAAAAAESLEGIERRGH